MSKILSFFSKLKILVILFITILIFNFFIFPYSINYCNSSLCNKTRIRSLDTSFVYSSKEIISYIQSKSYSQRKCIAILHLTIDTIYPIIYTIFLLSLLYLITNKIKLPDKLKNVSYIFPFIIIISDYIENLLIVVLLSFIKEKISNSNILLAKILPFITTIKWIFAGMTILMILGTILIFWFKKNRTMQ